MEFRPGQSPRENYAHMGANRALRLKSYEQVVPKYDWDAEVFSALDLATGRESVLDIGTGLGNLLIKLRFEEGHHGRLVGIDPYPDQIDNDGDWHNHGHNMQEVMSEIDFREGAAQDLSGFAENEFERISIIDTMYLVPVEEQEQAISQVKRVLAPEGRLVLRTSAADNKARQRQGEAAMAGFLGIEPPPLMNEPYNTDRAQAHLRHHFRDVQHKPLHGRFVYTAANIDVLYGSVLSLAGQFNPIPHISEFNAAWKHWLDSVILPEINQKGFFEDLCRRDLFIASNPN